MTKRIVIQLDEKTYEMFSRVAAEDNRPLPNFIETAVRRYIEENELTDAFETDAIRENAELSRSLTVGHQQASEAQASTLTE